MIRRLLLAASLAFALAASPVRAEEPAAEATAPPLPPNAITLSVFTNILGVHTLEYERVASRWFAPFLHLGFLAGRPLIVPQGASAGSRTGFTFDTGVRWYLFGHAPEGFFLSPSVGMLYVNYAASGESGVSMLATVHGGYTFRIFRHVVVSLGLGPHVTVGRLTATGPNTGLVGVGLQPRINVGGAF